MVLARAPSALLESSPHRLSLFPICLSQFLISRLPPEYAAHPQDKEGDIYRALLLTTTSTAPTPFQGNRSSHTAARTRLLDGVPYPPPEPLSHRYPDGRLVMKPNGRTKWTYIEPDWWDEHEDERDTLFLVLVLVNRSMTEKHMLEGLRD